MAEMCLLAAVFFAFLVQSCSAEGKPLVVKIITIYSSPLSFTLKSPSYRAASPLFLSCVVENVDHTAVFYYDWTSNCTGNCFARGESANVSTPYLHSYDTGVHTCTVYDDHGCIGSANITVNVIGAGIYVPSGSQVLSNNSLITTLSRDIVPIFRCLSGSRHANVGSLINPQGIDITLSTSDPFAVRRGRTSDPGTLFVRSVRSLRQEETGIYTYRTPDETGNIVKFYVGLYHSNQSGPIVSELSSSFTGKKFTLSCFSYNSPPTQVIWKRNGVKIDISSTLHSFSQILMHRSTSVYNNILTVTAPIEDLFGEYSCSVVNQIGSSNVVTRSVAPLEVHGHETSLVVGISRNITCTTNHAVRRIEWYQDESENPLKVGHNKEQSLIVMLKPDNTNLNGTTFTCKAILEQGSTYNKSVIVYVREILNKVEIEGAVEVPQAGSKYSLTCTVTSELQHTVTWLNPSGNEISGDTNVSVGADRNTTMQVLSFNPLKASHGGVYQCISTTNSPAFRKSAMRKLSIQIPPGSTVYSKSVSETLYTLQPLNLTCVTTFPHHQAIDIPVQVTHRHLNSKGREIHVDRIRSNNIRKFSSTASISSLSSNDSGVHTCISTIVSLQQPSIIVAPPAVIADIAIEIAILVTIEISYTSPDVYPVYSPPNYRAASGPVTLKCVAAGTTGQVTYRWSTTCESCSSRFSLTNSTLIYPLLSYHRAGINTCFVRDESNRTGSANTAINVLDAGLTVRRNYDTYYINKPSNDYFIYSSYITIFRILCISNASNIISGSFTLPDGEEISHSNSDGGRIRLAYSGRPTSFGVITCKIHDSNNHYYQLNIGIYDEHNSAPPVIAQLQREITRNGSLTLTYVTRNSPPTYIKVYKDGVLRDSNKTPGSNVTVTLLNRLISSFKVTTVICQPHSNLNGTYTVEVYNGLGRAAESLKVKGLEINCTAAVVTIGETLTCTCFGDINTAYKWYAYDPSYHFHSTETLVISTVTTNDEGSVYTCSVSTTCSGESANVTIKTMVPNSWAMIKVNDTSSSLRAMENKSYSLMCEVRVIPGVNLPVRMEWMGPDGAVVRSEGNRTVGEVQTQGTLSTLTLSFQPVFTSDAGRYTCRAAITVPWMMTQPSPKIYEWNMKVYSQALFQLKVYPVPQCLYLDPTKAHYFKYSIKKEIEDAVKERCNCSFSSSAIYSEEIVCPSHYEYQLSSHVTYRAIVNGSSDLLPSRTTLEHIQDWVNTEDSFRYYDFRLRIANTDVCSLNFHSFKQDGC